MITHAFSIYDRKSLQYHPPFFASAPGQAVRNLQDLVNDANTTIGRHPGDYVLFRIGAYDDSNGSMLPVSVLEHIIDASALVGHQADLFPEHGKKPAAPNGPLATGG